MLNQQLNMGWKNISILKPVTSCELGEILNNLRQKLDKEREEEQKRNDIYSAYRKGKLLLCNDALQNLIMGSRFYAFQAMEYIENNFGDSNLSLHQVCNHLGRSASRFSSIFKQAFGATFMDVMIGIRMKKARELLEMTELKSYEIAEKIGFSDPHYFRIAFKKATGKTPTEYARVMKQGGHDKGGNS